MFKKIMTMVIHVAIPIGVGLLSGYISSDAMKAYADLDKPFLSPPAAVFPVVWTILYLLMGFGAYLVFSQKEKSGRQTMGLIAYYLQLFMNFFWSIIFFNQKAYLIAFFLLLIMMIAVTIMLINYKVVSKLAFLMNVPLLVWLFFAGYLNLGVIVLNGV